MNTYIILTSSIAGFGGSKIYTANKVRYLENKGWHVQVFSAWDTNIEVEDLKKFSKNIIREILYPSFYFSNKKVKQILKTMKDKIASEDNVVVESHDMALSTWGELFAKEVEGKHFTYLLSENPENEGEIYRDYAKFKLKRHELAGIAESTVRRFFCSSINLDCSNTRLPAYCTNSVENIVSKYNKQVINAEQTIGIFGRLAKPSTWAAIEATRRYAMANRDNDIQVIVIGGGSIEEENRVIRAFESVSNVHIVMTGEIYPIPRFLIQSCDVMLAVAGCALISHDEGVKTITIDANDMKAIGVLGYTTSNATSRDSEKSVDIEFVMEQVIKKQSLGELRYPVISTKFDVFKAFDSHMEFLNCSEQDKNYYDWKSIIRLRKVQFIRQVYKCFSVDNAIQLHKAINRIRIGIVTKIKK